MIPPGRPKGYRPDSPEVRALRRRPRRFFGAAPLLLGDADLRPLFPQRHGTGTDPPVPDVNDQLSTDSCMENVYDHAQTFLAKRDGLPVVHMSRLAAYYEARAAIQDQGADDGTLPSALATVVDTYGMAPESDWPLDPTKVLVPPPPQVYRDGWGSRGALLTSAITDVPGQRQNEIRDHLNRGCPPGIGMLVDDPFEKGQVPLWTLTQKPLGAHYMLILAARSDGAFCLSSWGVGFGQMGGMWVAWSMIENPDISTDLLAFEHLRVSPGAGA